MPQIGWLDPSKGTERTFDKWLALAAKDGEALGFPYEVLAGIRQQLSGEHRPEGITVTQLGGCLRRQLLEGKHEFYGTPASNYAAFRGTVVHAMLESFPHPDAVIEERVWRRYGGAVLSGQIDKMRMLKHSRDDMLAYLEWVRLAHAAEMEDKPLPERPFSDVEFEIEDWKSKDELPTYAYVAKRYVSQGNLYRWLLRIPKGMVHIDIVFVSMEGTRTMSLYEGGNFRNGRTKPDQIWSDSEIKKYLEERFAILDASRRLDRPLAYSNVTEEDLWECQWCSAKPLCYRLAAEEARVAWLAGEKVDRIPPREGEI